MIEGRVDANLLAITTIEALTPDDSTEPLSAIIDTGFDGQLTLSTELIEQLQFPQVGTRNIDLGDGSTATTEVHLGAILWHETPRPVMVLRGGETPLVGMELMEHHRLTIDVRRGGDLHLEKLS